VCIVHDWILSNGQHVYWYNAEMKFSLKQLILFVTVAALLCGVLGYAYTRVQMERQLALQMRMVAEQRLEEAFAQVEQAESSRQAAEAKLAKAEQLARATEVSNGSQSDFKYSILYWNIESGGNDPATIAKQLIDLGRYDIIGLSEVDDPEPYVDAITQVLPDDFDFIRGKTGINNGREDDRLLLCVDNTKFELIAFDDIDEAGGVTFNDGRHRAPLYVRIKDRNTKQEIIVLLNHLARENTEFRQQQAAGLREWARTKTTPIIAIGDYNFDFDFPTQKGKLAFDEFLKDGVWKWIKPVEMIDTNWSDDGQGKDRYPDSMLGFNFVAGAAKDWKAECRVIVRDGDFPDDDKTSDHRPVELILKK
jgi:hypothetical protein